MSPHPCEQAVETSILIKDYERRFNELDTKLDLLVVNTAGWSEFVVATKWIRRIVLFIVPIIVGTGAMYETVARYFKGY